MSAKDVKQFSSSFTTIANYLFTSLAFIESAKLFEKYVIKTCTLKAKQKISSFKNGVFIYLAEGEMEKAESFIARAKKCKIPKSTIDEVEYEVMREYYYQKKWNRYEFYALKNQNGAYYHKTIDDFLNLTNIHRKFNNTDKEKRFREIARDFDRFFTKIRENAKTLRSFLKRKGTTDAKIMSKTHQNLSKPTRNPTTTHRNPPNPTKTPPKPTKNHQTPPKSTKTGTIPIAPH